MAMWHGLFSSFHVNQLNTTVLRSLNTLFSYHYLVTSKIFTNVWGEPLISSLSTGGLGKTQLQFLNIGKNLVKKIYEISIWNKKIGRKPKWILEKPIQHGN